MVYNVITKIFHINGGGNVRLKLLVVGFVLFLTACAPKSDLDAAKKQIEGLQTQVAALQTENAQLKAQLAKKPELPVTMSLRKAFMGPGLVAIFNTTVKAPVSALAIIHSAALGTTKQFELHLNPNGATELGHLQGAVIENGDTITLSNNNYSDVTFTINTK